MNVMKKKLLVAVLASVMTIGILPAAAFAKSDSDIAYDVDGGNIYFDKENGIITGADRTITSAEIPVSIERMEVKKIQSNAFLNCDKLEYVSIPDSVTDIGPSAFKGCTSLTDVNLGYGVQTISRETFSGCTSLVYLAIPDSVTSIGWNVFEGCTSLNEIHVEESSTKYKSENGVLFDDSEKELICYPSAKTEKSFEVPAGTLKIADYAFVDAKNLESVTLPQYLISIGNYAFTRCTGLKSMEIPDDVTNIGTHAFIGCKNLESIELPDKLIEIKESAFYGCSSLKSIAIPNTVRSIGKNAFYNCTGLESVKIPRSVISIGSTAFSYCTSLESVIIPGDMTTLNSGVFEECTNLKKVILPNCVKEIKGSAFHNCKSLQSIIIPKSVTTIGSNAFAYCTSLKTVTIPKSVKTISAYAFNGCAVNGNTVIENINYNGSEAEWNSISIGVNNNPLKKENINYDCLMPLVYGNSDTSIVVTMSEAALDSDAEFFADEINPSDAGITGLTDKAVIFDIYFAKDGTRIQPVGDVEVSIPIPAGLEGYRYKVFYVDTDGNKFEMKVKQENGCLVFITTHLSYYAVDVDESAVKTGDVNDDEQVNAKDKAILNRYLAGWEGYELKILNWDAADINKDGSVTAKDKAILNRYLAGWKGYDEYFE